MKKYIDSAILITSICYLGLTTLSFAEDQKPYEKSNVVKDIQLQRLDDFLEQDVKEIESQVIEKSPQKVLKTPIPQTISPVALNLIKEFEGFENQAYIDTDGTPVIGYGLSNVSGKSVQIGDRISVEQANAALNDQMQEIQRELNKAIKVELSDRQFSALVSLAFNVGVKQIQDSTLVKKINLGDCAGAANEFLRWDKANVGGKLVQLPGLTRRRQAEKQLFLQG